MLINLKISPWLITFCTCTKWLSCGLIINLFTNDSVTDVLIINWCSNYFWIKLISFHINSTGTFQLIHSQMKWNSVTDCLPVFLSKTIHLLNTQMTTNLSQYYTQNRNPTSGFMIFKLMTIFLKVSSDFKPLFSILGKSLTQQASISLYFSSNKMTDRSDCT